MGIYLRKALRAGPFRFNISKSGVGVSAGITGLRFGISPRGTYVHAGRGGLYYRKFFSSGRSGERRIPRNPVVDPVPDRSDEMEEIESADVLQLVDSDSEELVQEFRRRRRRIRFLPLFLLGVLGLELLLASMAAPNWLLLMVVGVLLVSAPLIWQRDRARKTVVLFYELEPEIEKAFEVLHEAFAGLKGCSRVWHIEARGDVTDWKRSAGADENVRRRAIRPTMALPKFVSTNVRVPMIPVGKQTLCFFPDRVLVLERRNVGAVSYADLSTAYRQTQFIESESVPRDSERVGTTWQYVNKKGGPDRRFKDNRQLPIMLYDDLHFSSSTGLNERIQLSQPGGGSPFVNSLAAMSGLYHS